MAGLGATHYDWRPDVQAVVARIEAEFPRAQCNTYVDHPWPGWDGVSIDVWGPGGRGDNIGGQLGADVLRYVLDMRNKPLLRHWIFQHTWWTSFGGRKVWRANDHSGELRHVHFTFWL